MLSKDKKGLSIMIGYVLLIVIAIVMSVVVYQWIKTYVPKDAPQCPDGVAIFAKDIKYICEDDTLKITMRNNGRFDVAGYYLRATKTAEQELATEDLSDFFSSGDGDNLRNA